MNDIKITLSGNALTAFATLSQRMSDLSPLMADIGELLLESTRQRFRSGQAPDGTPWIPLRDGSGRTPLILTGTMRDQIFPASGSDFVEISASAKQAAWHQFGTDPYVIEAREGVALKFPGASGPVFRRKVHHPGLPPRPFLGVSEQDDTDIVTLVGAYIDDALI